MEKVDKKELHILIDKIPDDGTKDIKTLLEEYLKRREQERIKFMLERMENAEVDEDFELTPEEEANIEHSRQEIEAGRFSKWDDVAKELDM